MPRFWEGALQQAEQQHQELLRLLLLPLLQLQLSKSRGSLLEAQKGCGQEWQRLHRLHGCAAASLELLWLLQGEPRKPLAMEGKGQHCCFWVC